MPNKIKVTKEEILKKSLEIVRTGGMEVLTARLIAKELGCSIQPVYYHFPTMDDLRRDVRDEIIKIYSGYIRGSQNAPEKHFKEVGKEYIMFAIKEKNFFKILFMSDDNYKLELNDKIDVNYDYILSTITDEYGITKEEANIIYENLWVTTHGLAVMIVTGFATPEPEKIERMLTNTFKGLLTLVKRGELI